MSLLLVGVSHRTAGLDLLDRIAANADSVSQLRTDIAASPYVAEAMVISTCNRIEIVTDITRFHGAVTDISQLLAKHSGVALDELTAHLYVHFEERAVEHLFSVTAGLDSMVVGEQQILGQVRSSLRDAQDDGTAARVLNELGQSALRVGKRVHTDTGIDRHGASVVSVALDVASQRYGSLAGRSVLVIGAGAMSSLALQSLRARGCQDMWVASRSPETRRKAAALVGAAHVDVSEVPQLLTTVDVVVSATGTTGAVLTVADVTRARAGVQTPLAVIDLALPHDTEPELSSLDGVTRVALADLVDAPGSQASHETLAAAEEIIADEVQAFLASQAAQRVEPIVVSLRAKANLVLEDELQRLRLKHPELSEGAIAAVEQTLRRTVSTLLHTPTVRMKQFAADPGGQRYAEAIHALFDLDPDSVISLSEISSDLTESDVREMLRAESDPRGER